MSSQVTLVATQNHSRVPLNRNRLQEKGKARETRIPTQEPTDESSHEMDVDINEQDEVMDVLQGMNTPDTSQQKSFHDSDQEAEERASPLVGPIQNSPRGSGYGSDDMQADLKIFGRDQRRGERSMPSTQEAASRAAGDRDGLRATRAPKRARRTFPGASKPAYAPEPPPSLLRNKRSPPQRNDESSDSESSVDVDTIPFLNTGKGQPQQRALQDPVDVPYVPPLGSRAAQYFKKRKV